MSSTYDALGKEIMEAKIKKESHGAIPMTPMTEEEIAKEFDLWEFPKGCTMFDIYKAGVRLGESTQTQKYQCYECEQPCLELSPRSRCVRCEHGRAQANETENTEIRKKYQSVVEAANDLAQATYELLRTTTQWASEETYHASPDFLLGAELYLQEFIEKTGFTPKEMKFMTTAEIQALTECKGK